MVKAFFEAPDLTKKACAQYHTISVTVHNFWHTSEKYIRRTPSPCGWMDYIRWRKTAKNNMFLTFLRHETQPWPSACGSFSCWVLGGSGWKKNDQTRIGVRWKDSLLDCMLRFLVTVPQNRENSQKPACFCHFRAKQFCKKIPLKKTKKIEQYIKNDVFIV